MVTDTKTIFYELDVECYVLRYLSTKGNRYKGYDRTRINELVNILVSVGHTNYSVCEIVDSHGNKILCLTGNSIFGQFSTKFILVNPVSILCRRTKV